MIFADGSIYEGSFNNGMFEGTGVYTYPNGDIYEGNYSKGLKEGAGVFTWANGSTYKGNFRRDMFETGVYGYANGDTYKGNFSEECGGSYWKCVDDFGVAYRNTPSMQDKDLEASGPVKSQIIHAVEHVRLNGDWLKVVDRNYGTKYLPVEKNGQVLFESV